MSIFSGNRLKIFLAAAVILMAGAGIFFGGKTGASQTEQPSYWDVRCPENQEGPCEIYWRYLLQETGQRVAEFAIGFPEDSKTARGVMILPLGILLGEGVKMQIDDGQVFKFQVRYCLQDGCIAYLNLDGRVLESMSRGVMAVISLKGQQGQDVKIEVSLSGFKKALKRIS